MIIFAKFDVSNRLLTEAVRAFRLMTDRGVGFTA